MLASSLPCEPPMISNVLSDEPNGLVIVTLEYLIVSPTAMHLQIASDPNFISIIYSNMGYPNVTTNINSNTFLANQIYYVRAMNVDNMGNNSLWSDYYMFHYDPDMSTVPAYTANAHNYTGNPYGGGGYSICATGTAFTANYYLPGTRTPNTLMSGDIIYTDQARTTPLTGKLYIRFASMTQIWTINQTTGALIAVVASC